MKLTYGEIVLGDDAAGDYIGDESGGHERIAQEDNLAFADEPFLAGRGNRKNTFSYIVDKVHATEAAAARWFRTHPDDLPDSAQLTWDNGPTQDRIAVAVLRSVQRVRRDGKSTLLRYLFVGGKVTTVTPS